MVRKKRRLIADMNITNLVDVTFTLLIIFMITAPLLTQGFKIDLPKVDADRVEINKTITIHVLKDRSVYIESEGKSVKASLSGFRNTFVDIYSAAPEKPVIINSDKRVPYGIIMQILGALKEAGVGNLGFLTDPAESRDAMQALEL
ncbi:MAG: biopolymer transporter ExbD [Fibrobacterota bacterium]